ncbi:unnamed protein product [Arabis nemorensis]|uniref:Uncharacterized protein n=1 Tax=Arabis nemorensis TaxID=586526 RepID=A0A565B270_9BRAS|nr:unnamed protein product [Arabis nemorensis]
MRRIVQKFPSLLARSFLHSPSNLRRSNTQTCLVPLLDRSISRFAFFSSDSNSALGPKTDEVVSKEELKKRIQSFLDDGDEDALPNLFEAMMIRKLSGKHDQSDDEVMEEVRKYPINDAHKKVDDIDSGNENDGHGGSSDSDIQSDDGTSDGDSSDSDIESDDDTSDGDSSDSDIEIDGPNSDHSSDSDSESD